MAIRDIFRLVCGNLVAIALSAVFAAAPAASAQPTPTPIYLDDSPSADEAIARATTLASNNILDEAARVLHKAIEEHGDRVTNTPDDPDLFIPVRERVHQVILANPALLERYIALHEPRAAALIRLGDIDLVERAYLLTPSGLEAALRIAQRHLEHAAFDAAALTLERIASHPSMNGTIAPGAAALARTVWSYLPQGSSNAAIVRELAERWGTPVASPAQNDAPRIDGPALLASASPYHTLQAPDLDGVLSKPMASARLGETPEIVRRLSADNSNRALPDQARVLNSMPVLAGDVVLTNDSESISAFDRFTLAQRWRVTLVAPPAMGGTRYVGLEDPNMVVVADPFAVGLMGVSQLGNAARERQLAAVDIRSGRVAWRISLSEQKEPELRTALMRGPVLAGNGVVVVSVVRLVTEHRLMSVSMAGFDLLTGKLRWHRPIGSIGYVQWAMNPEVIDAGVASDGIVYRGDRIGVMAAIEQATGRVRWVRRMARSFEPQPGEAEPWEGNAPVLLGDRLITLSPDRLRIVQLESRTGAMVSSTSALDMSSPLYLVRFGDLVAGVARFRIVAKPADQVGDAGARASEIGNFEQGGIRGRVMAAGDALIVPTPAGVSILRAASDALGVVSATREDLALDAAGNAMIAPGQVIVADDDRVHSYLSWPTASTLLRTRIDASPDPTPAVTYAELAYRAAKDADLVAAVDAAVDRIEADPLAEATVAARARLFASVMEMVEPRAPRQFGGPLADRPRNELVDRLRRIAATPEERVAALLAAGRMHETQNAPARAVEKYQEILSSPVLADAAYTGGSTRVPGEVEAIRRLRRVVGVEGRSVYAAYDAELDRLLIERAASTDPRVFTDLARRYPVAARASSAWLEAARRWRAASNHREAVRALEEGLITAAETGAANDPVFGEIAGTLVKTLVDAGRFLPAARVLEDIDASPSPITLTADGAPIDIAAITARISTELATRSRRPRIGPEFVGVTLMEGYMLADIADDRSEGIPAEVTLLESIDGPRSLWTADPDGGLRMLWETDAPGEVVRMDHEAVYFSELRSPRMADRTVSRVSMRTGEIEWTSPAFHTMFSERDPFQNIQGGPPRVDTPLQRSAPLTDLFALFEPDTLVLVERTGRIAAIDIGTGRPLWSTELSRVRVDTVHDASSGDGLIAIGGTRLRPPADGGALGRGFSDVVAILDARTGAPTFEYEESTPIRWVRVTDDGTVLVGFDAGIASLDATRRAVVWRNDRPVVGETMEAWIVAGGILVRDFDNTLYLLDPRNGIAAETPVAVADRLDAGVGFVEVNQIPGGNMVVGTDRGVALIDRTGGLLGLDASDFGQRILLPEVADGAVVTISRDGNPVDDGLSRYRINMYDTRSVRTLREPSGLVLGAVPRAIRIIDDRILVSAGSVVAVIDAPGEANSPAAPPGIPGMNLPTPRSVPPVPVPRETPPSEPAGDAPQ